MINHPIALSLPVTLPSDIIFLTLFVLQTADPPYKISKALYLFNDDLNDQDNYYKNVSAETLDTILKFLYRMVKENDDNYWKTIDSFSLESYQNYAKH